MRNIVIFSLLLVITNYSLSQTANRFGFGRSDQIPVFINGDSLFNPWTGGLNSPQFSTIDLNLDGVDDLFVFDRSTGTVHTFININSASGPTYKYAPEYEKYFPKMNSWVLLRDYNCDGKKDIFTNTPGGIMVYKNISTDSLEFEKAINGPYIITNHWGNNVNLYVNSLDIPSISDIDGDGDLDILVFGIYGSAIQYHKNMSMELYGNCDSIVYEVKNDCWGRFTESSTSSTINLYDTLIWPCNGTIANPEGSLINDVSRSNRHVGSTVMAFDENGSGVMDLLIGDVDASHLTLLTNGGSVANSNSAMISQDNSFPSYDQSVNIPLFPASYFEDVDNDGVKDLIIASNLVQNNSPSEDAWDRNNVWFYKNNNTNDDPVFEHQKSTFLIEDMINVGRGAYPILFDYDNDGLKDLVIAHIATSYPNIASKKKSLTLFKNTGTSSAPKFEFVTDNFANLHPSSIGNELIPSFGDLDGDGDMDMVIGTANGDLFWKENTGGAGNVSVFSSPAQPLLDKDGNQVTTIGNSYPFLIDLDRNGTLDLVVGDVYGKLHYFNNSEPNGYMFSLETNNLGNVNVTQHNEFIGYAAPNFIDLDGEYKLFVGSNSGFIHLYDDIENNITGSFNLVDSTMAAINTGRRSSIWVDDLFDNDNLIAIVGNFRGGLSLFSEYDSIFLSTDHIDPFKTNQKPFNFYPNPASDIINIQAIGNQVGKNTEFTLFDVNGKIMASQKLDGSLSTVDIQSLSSGLYFIEVRNQSALLQREKIIIHKK